MPFESLRLEEIGNTAPTMSIILKLSGLRSVIDPVKPESVLIEILDRVADQAPVFSNHTDQCLTAKRD